MDEFKQLIIDRVRKSDTGNYTCEAQSLGIIKRSKTAVVIVTGLFYNFYNI